MNTQTFAEKILAAARAASQRLQPGKVYTAEELCGAAIWDPLNNSERRSAGHIIAAAVANGLLPLKCMGRRYDNHQQYQLL